jgi:anti-sigma B factor antagonist
MEITTRQAENVMVLELTGRFDAYGAPPVADRLAEAAKGGPAAVLVNLTGVTFIDSTGCAVLVRGMKQCRERGGDLRLCGLQRPVRMIFELTRLDRAFDIFPDEQTALKAHA